MSSKRSKFILALAVLTAMPSTLTHAQVPSSSISISPNLNIPDKELYVKEKPTYEDVQKTMNLEEIKLSYSTAIAELSMPIQENLGMYPHEIDKTQLDTYNKNVKDYTERVENLYEIAIEAEEIDEVMEAFRNWLDAYKNAILRDRELAVEQKSKEVADERARLEKIIQAEKALEKEVTEVVDLTQEAESLGIDTDAVTTTNTEQEVTIQESSRISYEIPNLGRQYLTYMPHRTITSRSSDQWKLQQVATTNNKGYRTYKGMPLIALASSYGTKMGTVYEITFDDGNVLKAVLGDAKADAHTDSKKQYRDATGKYDGSSGNILEMILDGSRFSTMAQANRMINGDYPNRIVSIVKVGHVGEFK